MDGCNMKNKPRKKTNYYVLSIKAKRRIRKNPVFYKDLLPLVDKETTVRIKSDNGILSLTGPLKLSSDGIFYVIVDEMVGGLTKQSYEGRVYFDVSKVINITKNIIELQPNPDFKPLSEILQEIKKRQLSEIINNDTVIHINQKFYGSGDYFPPSVRGKLKYNSKDDLFYLRNGKLTIMCAFKFYAVRFVVVNKYISQVMIEI